MNFYETRKVEISKPVLIFAHDKTQYGKREKFVRWPTPRGEAQGPPPVGQQLADSLSVLLLNLGVSPATPTARTGATPTPVANLDVSAGAGVRPACPTRATAVLR